MRLPAFLTYTASGVVARGSPAENVGMGNKLELKVPQWLAGFLGGLVVAGWLVRRSRISHALTCVPKLLASYLSFSLLQAVLEVIWLLMCSWFLCLFNAAPSVETKEKEKKGEQRIISGLLEYQ